MASKTSEDERCGRRDGKDRRVQDLPIAHDDQRSGKDRRSGDDRRTEPR